MIASKLTHYLEDFFPLSLQLDFDKCGLQVGDLNQDIQKVMISLNADNEALDLAMKKNCQMLITHHPFFLEDVKNLDYQNAHGQFMKKAIENKIVVYSLHTCLDQGKNGISMNDWLIQCFDCHDIQCFEPDHIGKKAILNKEYTGDEFIKYVGQCLSLHHYKYSRNTNKTIKTFALLGGSGADYIETLVGEVDCFITGDTKHRHAKYALDHDILLIDVNHHVEVIMEEKVKEMLKDFDIEVECSSLPDYYQYI